MSDPLEERRTGPESAPGWWSRTAALSWRHRGRLLRGFALLLVIIVVLQNVEPTTIDILFWSIARVPKLILILASMGLGILFWEVGRHAWRRRPVGGGIR